jgi:L-fuconolactonase
MFEHAARHEWIAAVVAWVALDNARGAAERLAELAPQPKLRGIRHLILDEADPHWILKPSVLESLALLDEAELILELPAVYPRHLGDVPELARSFPRLAIVVDHLGKPPLGQGSFGEWATELEHAAEHPNVAAKISALNTATTRADWSAADLRPAIETALRAFGPDRLMCGSDWPVALPQRRLRARLERDAPRSRARRAGRRRPARAARRHGASPVPAPGAAATRQGAPVPVSAEVSGGTH